MSNHIAAKSLTITVCAVALSLLLLTLVSCDPGQIVPWLREMPPDQAERATRMAEIIAEDEATEAAATVAAQATATAAAQATSEAEATAAAATAAAQATATVAPQATATVAAQATPTSEEGVSTEPALALEDVAVHVKSCSPYERFGTPVPNEFVCSYDVTFSLKCATAGHSAYLVCFVGDGDESDRNPVSEGSGTSEVIVPIADMIVRGEGETRHAAFCQLRDAGSDEWLAEAFHGDDAYDASLAMPAEQEKTTVF
jgi:hypothetical protein